MNFSWDMEKNKQLQVDRKVSFEDVLIALDEGRLLDILPHHNPQKYPNQRLFIVSIRGYVYYVPFVENGGGVFLKNIIPSRKYQKIYQGSQDA
ncbi:MAG: toxin [Campylobacterales bacterium]